MNDNNLKKGVRFKSGQSGNPAGRKPSRLKKFIKEYNVSKEDVYIILKNLLFNYDYESLLSMYKKFNEKDGGKLPAGIAAFISGILHDVKKGDMRVISLILDRPDMPKDINLRDFLPYTGKEREVSGTNDSVPLIEEHSAEVTLISLVIRAFGHKNSLYDGVRGKSCCSQSTP